MKGHGCQHGYLGGEGLGARHADFRPGVGVGPSVGFARNAGPDHVAHPKDVGTRLLGGADGRQGVCGFATLRDGQHHVSVPDDGISVSEFRGVFHFDRDACQALEEVFGHQPRVPACSTPQNEDALGFLPLGPIVVDTGHVRGALLEVDPSADGVPNGSGLLVNLLEHEVIVSTLL